MIQLTAMEAEGKTPVRVAAIILAAGGSQRMGRPKQLLSIDGQPMVRRVTAAVCDSRLTQVVVVVGAHASLVSKALAGLPVEPVYNEDWAEGMSTSVRVGIRALRADIGAVLVILADQPALTPKLVQLLVERYRATEAPIVAPFYRGQRGNPVLFDRSLFPELLSIQGDRGGRMIITRYDEQMERVECHDPGVVQDVDTLDDYVTASGSRGRG